MRSGTLIWLFIGVCSKGCLGRVYNYNYNYNYNYDRPRIVTYGEPCVAPRQLPIRIEGPKSPARNQQIPLTLDFSVISDMYARRPYSQRLEYPIAIDVPLQLPLQLPLPLPSPSSTRDIVLKGDTLRGKTYAYDTYVPPASAARQLPSKRYNFDVAVPVSSQEIIPIPVEESTSRHVQRSRGLSTRIDRMLLPACEVSSSYGC